MKSLPFAAAVPIYAAAARPRGAGLLLCATVLAAGCASESIVKDYVPQIVTPYRIDIQQGNFVTQDMVDKLQAGQTRDQVRFILGTPLLTDVFHADRWDYIFRSSKGWREPDKHKLTVYFENEKVKRWVSDVPPAPVANAQPAEEPGFFGRLLGSKPAPAPAPAPASPTSPPTAAVTPAPTDAGVAGASNVTIAGSQPVPPPPTQQTAPPVVAPAARPADPADKPEEKPGVVRRMFGWLMPGTGNTAASPEESRAASPDPAKPPAAAPNPPQAVQPKPQPEPAAAPVIAPAVPTATATAVPVAPEPAPTVPLPAPPPPPVISAAPPAPPAPPPAAAPVAPPAVIAQAAPAPAPAPAAPARAPEPMASPNEIISAIEQWRNAWQDKDATRYLAAYAPDFKPAGGLTRAKWEAQRRDRLTKPSFIIVRIVDPQVTLSGSDVAVAVFVQEYESSILKESGRKTLKFGSYGGKWLIREETMTAR